ncbi:MAG TPA: PQQ-binding-like beta-propeller repeat protein, partial [Gemmatimonadales bacterium]|nr:PQQ-binding-like beta-propeller repeat protein [Gemmatimonadales bacterium]
DSGVILYPNYGGPIKLDLFSGALRWRAESLANRDPPTRRDGWAPPLLHQGVLYVPYEKRMMALRSSDGQILWDRQDKLEGRAFQLAHTPHGLLVLTVPGPNDVGMIHDPAPGLELLDPGTGASVWPKRISRLGGTGLFLARGDSAYISAKNKLFALHLPSGVLLEERKLEFEGGEDAGRIEPWNGGLLIQGHQNLLLLDSLGGEVYFRYFKAPGKSLFAKIASTALIVAFNVASYSVTPPGGMYTVITNNPVLTARYHATERARDYVYMLTSEPDASGRTGFSLVRVHRADGSETGRVWVDDRSPDMALDPITGTVFLKTSDTQIVALRF